MLFLDGVRVLDASRVLAGPIAAQILADMGAETLKIESPDGDDTRAWGPPFQGPMAAYFQSCNRNKASLPLDLKTAADRETLARLAAKADVVIDNFPLPTRRRLGLDDERLRALNPRLVTLSVTGYEGGRAHEPGYDIMIQAESGLMGVTGPAEGEPCKVGVAVVDALTGMMAANGLLAGLFRRERTGAGAALGISLYRTALFSLVNVAANYLVSGQPSGRWGNAHANIAPYQSFQLKDRSVIIGAGNDGQYRRLCAMLGLDDPELLGWDNAERVANRRCLTEALQAKLAQWEAGPLLDALRREKVPAAPILRPDEALAQVRRWDPGAIVAMPHKELGEVLGVAPPLVGDGLRSRHASPPLLGEGGGDMAARWLDEAR